MKLQVPEPCRKRPGVDISTLIAALQILRAAE